MKGYETTLSTLWFLVTGGIMVCKGTRRLWQFSAGSL